MFLTVRFFSPFQANVHNSVTMKQYRAKQLKTHLFYLPPNIPTIDTSSYSELQINACQLLS